MSHATVTPAQREQAKELRRNMNRPEGLLWHYLKAGHLAGLSFRRQAPIGGYVVDFVCHQAGLVVEVDGESHDFPERAGHDHRRDAWLATRGLRVLRFANAEVMSNLDGVLRTIEAAARDRLVATPLPDPPPQGGREPNGREAP